jgi:hypothetical protein
MPKISTGDVIDCHFNMDGAKPAVYKVGLINEYHIRCFLINPFKYEWCTSFVIDDNMIQTFAKNMIAHSVLADVTRRTKYELP